MNYSGGCYSGGHLGRSRQHHSQPAPQEADDSLRDNSNTPTEPPFISSTRASAWRAKRDPEAKMLSLQSFPRKGVSLGYVGRIKT